MRNFWSASFAVVLGLAVAARADDQASAKAVIEKAVKATGGEEVLTKLTGTDVKFKGKWYGMGEGIPYTGQTLAQIPNKLRFQVDLDVGGMKFQFIQVVDGEKGWISANSATMEMDKDALEEAKHQLYVERILSLVPLLKDKEFTLAPLGEIKVGDQTAVGVKVSSKGHRDVNLYFSKDKGLLLKAETQVKDPMQGGQEFHQSVVYSDFKDVSGRQVPMNVRIERDGKLYVDGETTEVKLTEKLDDSLFAKP
jgi:hypothetical protein